jgi:hypothetical protein
MAAGGFDESISYAVCVKRFGSPLDTYVPFAFSFGMDNENRFGRRRPSRASPAFRHVYFIEARGRDLVKIGCADDAEKRLRTLQTGSPDALVLAGVYHTDDAVEFERRLHRKYRHLWERGEWFRIDDEMREAMGRLFTVADSEMRICLRGPRGPERGLATVYSQPGDTAETLALRVCRVAEACGLAVEYEAAA